MPKKLRPENDLASAKLRSHEKHMMYIYGLRFAGLFISLVCIVIGAIMIFKGLSGSFNWAFEEAHTFKTKLTNASPGIGFALFGVIMGYFVLSRDPVNYTTDDDDMSLFLGPRPTRRPKRKSRANF